MIMVRNHEKAQDVEAIRRSHLTIDYPRTFEYFNKSVTDGLKVINNRTAKQKEAIANNSGKVDTSGIGLNLVYQIQVRPDSFHKQFY